MAGTFRLSVMPRTPFRLLVDCRRLAETEYAAAEGRSDPAYCDVIVTRREQFTGKKAERIPGPEPKEAAPTEVEAAVEAKV